jgi:hypothetical protein
VRLSFTIIGSRPKEGHSDATFALDPLTCSHDPVLVRAVVGPVRIHDVAVSLLS